MVSTPMMNASDTIILNTLFMNDVANRHKHDDYCQAEAGYCTCVHIGYQTYDHQQHRFNRSADTFG